MLLQQTSWPHHGPRPSRYSIYRCDQSIQIAKQSHEGSHNRWGSRLEKVLKLMFLLAEQPLVIVIASDLSPSLSEARGSEDFVIEFTHTSTTPTKNTTHKLPILDVNPRRSVVNKYWKHIKLVKLCFYKYFKLTCTKVNLKYFSNTITNILYTFSPFHYLTLKDY